MKSKNIRITVDIIMLIIFILLYLQNGRVLSSYIHVILGFIIVLVVALHVMLNWKWVKNTVVHTLRQKANAKSRWMLWLAVGLFISLLVTVISGVVAWQRLDGMVITHELALRQDLRIPVILHQEGSMVCLILIIVHIWIHRKYLLSFLRSKSKA